MGANRVGHLAFGTVRGGEARKPGPGRERGRQQRSTTAVDSHHHDRLAGQLGEGLGDGALERWSGSR